MSAALDDIAAERARQIQSEGWTPQHDDNHWYGELAQAAACYALESSAKGLRTGRTRWIDAFVTAAWPWAGEWWKPSDRRRDLVKAGSLIVAEIERLDRRAIADRAAGAGRS